MVKLYGTTLFASTAPSPSVRIIISYYSTTRLEREQILGLFELCPNQPKKIPAKFVLNSIWLTYGSLVIRLQRLQTAACKNMLVSILHNILTSLECLTSFHKRVSTQSYLALKTEKRLENYSRLEITKHLQQIMLLTKRCPRPVSMSDAYYSQFAVKFTGSSCFNVAETSTLFRSVVYVAQIGRAHV